MKTVYKSTFPRIIDPAMIQSYHVTVIIMIVSSLCQTLAYSGGNEHVVDICNEIHKFRCKDGELISLADISCVHQNSCPYDTNQTLFDLCQGQQTCTTLGIDGLLGSHCRNGIDLKDSVHVKFTCVPGSSSSCITNICDDFSTGLACPQRSFVHLQRMSCFSAAAGTCSRSIYTTMFLCEGVSRCASSGMKILLSQVCQHELVEKRNVIIHYSCVPEQHVENRCSSTKYRILDKDYGVIRSPSTDSNNRRTSNDCRWLINPVPGNKIKVTVHLVNTKIVHSGCDPGVLNITFEDCNSESTITRSFCIVDNSSVELVSCGQVKIFSVIPHGLESSDKFIVSYTRYHSNNVNSEPLGMPRCIAPAIISPSETPQQPISLQPFPKATEQPSSQQPISITHSYNLEDGVVEYRDSLSQQGVRSANTSGKPKASSKQLKKIILYIFFGVVILVLIVALIAVLISYYRISMQRDPRGDSSEKTALCQHHEDTPLDTFQNHFTETCGTSETTYAFRADHNSDQVLATVHHDAVSEQEETDNRFSSGSRLSTFLSGKRDTDFRDLINTFQTGNFALYSSLGDSSSNDHINIEEPGYYEMADTGHYDIPRNQDICDIYEIIDHEKSRDNGNDTNQKNSFNNDVFGFRNNENEHNIDHQSLAAPNYSSSSDLHYHINNDEYAIVCKQKKQPKSIVSDDDQQDLTNGASVDFCPTSGPYDKKRQFTTDTSTRWSKGENERWGDDL